MSGAERDRDFGNVEILRIDPCRQIELKAELAGRGRAELGQAAESRRGERRGVEAALLADEGGDQVRIDAADPSLGQDGGLVRKGIEKPAKIPRLQGERQSLRRPR